MSLAEAMNSTLLKTAARVWLMEILVSSFNYLVLMKMVCEPIWGELAAYRIGMSTRIVYIMVLYVWQYYIKR